MRGDQLELDCDFQDGKGRTYSLIDTISDSERRSNQTAAAMKIAVNIAKGR